MLVETKVIFSLALGPSLTHMQFKNKWYNDVQDVNVSGPKLLRGTRERER